MGHCYELANNGVKLKKNKANGGNLKPHLKRQCTKQSAPTSLLPTQTTREISTQSTEKRPNRSETTEDEMTLTGVKLAQKAVFHPTDKNWRTLLCTRLGLPAPRDKIR